MSPRVPAARPNQRWSVAPGNHGNHDNDAPGSMPGISAGRPCRQLTWALTVAAHPGRRQLSARPSVCTHARVRPERGDSHRRSRRCTRLVGRTRSEVGKNYRAMIRLWSNARASSCRFWPTPSRSGGGYSTRLPSRLVTVGRLPRPNDRQWSETPITG